MAAIVDWTVDKMLSSVQLVNDQAASIGTRIKADRARYMETLRSLPQVADPAARERLRGQLQEWIHRQVAVENRFNSFAGAWGAAKAQARQWLKGANIAAPAYLNALPAIVPAVIVAAIVTAVGALAYIAVQNNLQGKALDGLNNLVNNAAAHGWSAAETAAAVDSYRRTMTAAADATTPAPDPFGLAHTLQSAVPVLALVAALVFLPPLVRQLQASRGARA